MAGIAKALVWEQTHPRAEVVARAIKIARERGRPEDAAVLKYWKSPGVGQRGGVIARQDIARWITWLEDSGSIPKGSVRPQ
ncbi:MAG: hypothetical protein V7607_2105, partial [Solirubrobacteraceae bacterium]